MLSHLSSPHKEQSTCTALSLSLITVITFWDHSQSESLSLQHLLNFLSTGEGRHRSMKRPNTVPSSSSYRENTHASENLHSKRLGCMSGIFQLVCKYHHNRKSLTFGKKKKNEKNIVIYSSTKPPSPSPNKDVSPPPDQRNKAMLQQPRRFSCELVPDRSPVIPPEIRRSNSVNSPANYFNPSTPSPPHSVVARLMGLTSAPPESTSEKRRKLMGALEKCDQDLKALKKIIDSVRSSDLSELRPDPTAESETKTVMSENEQPSPVSVLDELTRSPTLSQTRGDRRQSNGTGFFR